jgi:hypothetical protein
MLAAQKKQHKQKLKQKQKQKQRKLNKQTHQEHTPKNQQQHKADQAEKSKAEPKKRSSGTEGLSKRAKKRLRHQQNQQLELISRPQDETQLELSESQKQGQQKQQKQQKKQQKDTSKQGKIDPLLRSTKTKGSEQGPAKCPLTTKSKKALSSLQKKMQGRTITYMIKNSPIMIASMQEKSKGPSSVS